MMIEPVNGGLGNLQALLNDESDTRTATMTSPRFAAEFMQAFVENPWE